ncbi:MAG TPA: serine/threonine-protein phosphatase [Gammaproteobacteria bacterium]|nr:serine/threonine-protein phosphatase [Gammaproteobacteria bacterium]
MNNTGCYVTSSGLTHVGCVRACNEDAYLEMPDSGLWCVADGMGGHDSGDVASQSIIQALAQLGAEYQGYELTEQVTDVLQTVNTYLLNHARSIGGDAVVGSTVVVLVLEGENYHCYWTGDSRCYLWRDNFLKCITRDHTLVSEAVAEGRLTQVQADKHPKGHVLTRAIGAYEDVTVEVETGIIFEGDTFLLCTDGLTRIFNDQMIAERLLYSPPDQVNASLIDEALSLGASDNITSIMLTIE